MEHRQEAAACQASTPAHTPRETNPLGEGCQCWRPRSPAHLPGPTRQLLEAKVEACAHTSGVRLPPYAGVLGLGGAPGGRPARGQGHAHVLLQPSAALASLSSQPQLGRLPGGQPRGSRRRGGLGNTHCLTFCASGRARPLCKAQGGGQRRVGGWEGGRVRAGRPPSHLQLLPP